jgi:hypothetical protein
MRKLFSRMPLLTWRWIILSQYQANATTLLTMNGFYQPLFLFLLSFSGVFFYVLNVAKYGIEKFFPFEDLMSRYEISQRQIDQYSIIEKNIQNYVAGKYLYNRDRYLKKRISLDDLMPCLDGTYQRLMETHQRMMNEYEEKSQQWTLERESIVSHCDQQNIAIQEILHSTSWKLTRPLRWLKGLWQS